MEHHYLSQFTQSMLTDSTELLYSQVSSLKVLGVESTLSVDVKIMYMLVFYLHIKITSHGDSIHIAVKNNTIFIALPCKVSNYT